MFERPIITTSPERGERALPLHDFFYVICDLFVDHRFPEPRHGPYLDGLPTCISPYCVIIWHHTMPFLFIQEDPCAPSYIVIAALNAG